MDDVSAGGHADRRPRQGPESPRVVEFDLTPLGVTIVEGTVGVVHYSYVAEGQAGEQRTRKAVSGRWTEVYLKQGGAWQMIAVSGGPDGER